MYIQQDIFSCRISRDELVLIDYIIDLVIENNLIQDNDLKKAKEMGEYITKSL